MSNGKPKVEKLLRERGAHTDPRRTRHPKWTASGKCLTDRPCTGHDFSRDEEAANSTGLQPLREISLRLLSTWPID